MEQSSWAAMVAAVAAWVAAAQAFRSARTAGRAYKLALEQERRLQPSLELYLVDAYIQRLTSPERRLCVFQITVTNKSFAGNSLKDMQLIVHCSHGQEVRSGIAIPHSQALAMYLSGGATDVLRIPSPIAAHAAVGGLALFEAPEDLFRDVRIESYTLRLVDTFGHETEREAILLQERER